MGVISGKVVLVTGAGRGLGSGIMQALAAEGASVAVSAPTFDELDRTISWLDSMGTPYAACACDVTDVAQVKAFVDTSIEQFGQIDALVNNAAVTGFSLLPVEELQAADLRRHIEVDVIGSLNCMQASFPHLRRAGGSIVNMGSNGGTEGYANHGPYAVAKEGLRGLTKVAAREWGRYGITVNTIVPYARTEQFVAWLADQPDGGEEVLQRDIPLARVGDPVADIGGAVVALVSPLARYITGRTIFVDGGKGSWR